jgi:Glycosyl transferase family 2
VSPERPVLSIVIPALDEEAALGETLRRCLAARAEIIAASPVREVEVIVVNDGSSDGTEAVARAFDEVGVLGFDRNRGYGAAIQSGFAFARGDWLAFLDADGTCEPRCLAALCRALAEEKADLAIGARRGPGSQMPRLRAFGNTLFAWMLGLLSSRPVSDTASGVRVLRRSALPDLEPLPSGLHFTPAMTARGLLEGKLRLVEVPVPYARRIGESKLSVARDGVRFLASILRAALIYRPAPPLLAVGAVLATGALLIGGGPALYWLRHRELQEWMIYRILLAWLLATAVALLASTAVVADRIAAIAHGRRFARSGLVGLLGRSLTRRAMLGSGLALGVAAVAVSWPGIVEYTTAGEVTMHWSRAVLSSLLVVLALALATSTFLLETMDLIRAQRGGHPAPPAPDRVRRARPPEGSIDLTPPPR